MKKALAIILALCLAAALSVSALAAETNLIPAEGAEWTDTPVNDTVLTYQYGEDGLTVKDSGGQWPSISYTYDEPIVVDVKDAAIAYKISSVNGAGNICIILALEDGNTISIQKQFTDESVDFATGVGYDSGSGDIYNNNYEGEIALEGIKVDDGISVKDYTPADGKISITKLTIYATAFAEYTINKLAITTADAQPDQSEPADESSEPAAESSEPADESKDDESSVPSTGDSGIIALSAVAVIAAAGAVVIKKRRA